MNRHAHAVVWIDHRVAKIFEFNREDAEKRTIRHWQAEKQIHHKAGSIGAGHAREDDQFFQDVADAMKGPAEILITGPGHAKWQLRAWLNLQVPHLSQRVMAVVDADHPSDRQIVGNARKYFSRIDRMTPQIASQRQ